MTQSHGQLMRSYIEVLNENDDYDPTKDPNEENRINAAFDETVQFVDRVLGGLKLRDPKKLLNTLTFPEICEKYDVNTGDVLEIWLNAERQEKEDKEYDHWGVYDQDPDY